LGGQKIKVILITSNGLEHRYVTNILAQKIDFEAIILDHGIKRNKLQSIKVLLSRYTTFQIAMRMLGKAISIFNKDDLKKQQAMVNIFTQQLCDEFNYAGNIIEVNGINSDESVALIKKIDPDLLLIYGTGIIKNRILDLPKKLCLNMHTGISPYYRGAGCSFWPLYDGKPEMIGATVHECTSDVDGGIIYKIQKANLSRDDDEYCMFARAVAAGAKIYQQVAWEFIVNGKSNGFSQDLSIGKEYKSAMKNWWHDVEVRKKVKNGLISDYVNSKI